MSLFSLGFSLVDFLFCLLFLLLGQIKYVEILPWSFFFFFSPFINKYNLVKSWTLVLEVHLGTIFPQLVGWRDVWFYTPVRWALTCVKVHFISFMSNVFKSYHTVSQEQEVKSEWLNSKKKKNSILKFGVKQFWHCFW